MYQRIDMVINSRIDHLELSVMMLQPELKSGQRYRGIVQLVHGMSEYKERYLPFMEYLTEQGFITIIHDHRGHGGSVRRMEDLGYMYGAGAEGLLDDILLVNETVEKQFPGIPLILFGHSMGSLAVRAFARKHDDRIDALIVCGSPSNNPGRAMGSVLAGTQKLLLGGHHPGKLIEKISFGPNTAKFRKEKSSFAWLCSDPAIVKSYEESPYCGFTFSADAYLVLFDLMKQAYAAQGWQCTKPDMPVLFIGGADDPCIGGPAKYARSLLSMRMAGYHNVKGKLYPGMRHEILNEKEHDRVFRDVSSYLKKRGF